MQSNNFYQLVLGDEIKGFLIITPGVPDSACEVIGCVNYFFYSPLISFQCAISDAPAGLCYCGR